MITTWYTDIYTMDTTAFKQLLLVFRLPVNHSLKYYNTNKIMFNVAIYVSKYYSKFILVTLK